LVTSSDNHDFLEPSSSDGKLVRAENSAGGWPKLVVECGYDPLGNRVSRTEYRLDNLGNRTRLWENVGGIFREENYSCDAANSLYKRDKHDHKLLVSSPRACHVCVTSSIGPNYIFNSHKLLLTN